MLNCFDNFSFSLVFVFKFNIKDICFMRILTYHQEIIGTLGISSKEGKLFALVLFLTTLVIFKKKIFSPGGKFLFLWLTVPLICYMFYQGNHGYLWGYYFCGILPAFFILFASCLSFLSEKRLGNILVIPFLIVFLYDNLVNVSNYLKVGVGITFEAQLKAIDWIYEQAQGKPFNADFYVPPQIYYSYSYLMKWYGKQKYGYEPAIKQVSELYTLYEPDLEHPQFLQSWLERQDKIGKIEKEYNWGDITVHKRRRIIYEEN